jgi:flagellar protein FliO/FliZ
VLAVALSGMAAININPVKGDKAVPEMTSENSTGRDSFLSAIGTPTMAIVKMISALIVVIFCIYFGIYLLKRLMNRRLAANGGRQNLEVLETSFVGPKKQVSLIRVADRSVLIGITESNISVLSELSEEETAVVLQQERDHQNEPVRFSELLKKATGQIRSIVPVRQPKAESA